MELLIGAAIYALIIQKMWSAARTDHELAKQGKVSPRLEAKYGSAAAARAKVEQYGFTDYLRDAYHDFWGRRGDALAAARTAEPAEPGEKVRLRDRLAAAGQAITRVATKARNSTVGRALIDPVELPKRQPAAQKNPTPAEAETPPEATPAAPEPTTPGATMTTPTGEVTNFAAAIAEIDALLNLIKLQHDQAEAAMRALNLVDAAIDGMQARQKAIAQGAISLAEHLAALHVDAGSLAPIAEAAEVLTAGTVDELLEHVERLKAIVQRVITACDAATAALNKARGSLIGKYADAAQTVEESLGGDSRFLNGDNAGAAPAQPAPARAS